MDRTYVSANVHADTDTEIVIKEHGDTRWLLIGSVAVFADAETMARIHAVTAPRAALPAWMAEHLAIPA